MIYVLYGKDRHNHPEAFTRLFKLRHDVFVINRGWSLPCQNGIEIDQYDTEDAVYIFDKDGDGDIKAHVRLTPTMRSSLLADYFPHLIENGEDPRGPTICEATRFMILPTQRDKSTYKSVKAGFVAAVTEWCIEHGYSHMQTVIDAAALSSYVEVSILTSPLGLTHPFGGGKGVPGGGECLAFRLPMCRELLQDIYTYGAIVEPGEAVWRPLPLEAA